MIPTPKPSNNLPINKKEESYKTNKTSYQTKSLITQIKLTTIPHQNSKPNHSCHLQTVVLLTLAKEMASHPIILGIEAIINDCKQHSNNTQKANKTLIIIIPLSECVQNNQTLPKNR
jgi:hypothetical protein